MSDPSFIKKGVTVRALYLLLSLAFASTGFSQVADKQAAEVVVPWTEATKHLDKVVTIEGRVLKAERKQGGVFLYFHEKGADHFQVLIPTAALTKFKFDPVARFQNRRVQVNGKVEEVWTNAAGVMYRGSPFIQVNDPKKIAVAAPKSKGTS